MKTRIIFAGDFCTNAPEEITFDKALQGIIETSDINIVNFEAPLIAGKSQSPNGFYLEQSDKSPLWLENNGFNMFSLANNHMLDFGRDGLFKTQKAFKKPTVGAGNWDEAYQVKFLEINGLKIGFFSATSADFSALKDYWTDREEFGCAWINHSSVNKIIREAKKECDYLFVISHGGIEFMDVPLPEWRERYRELIEMGADGIIGSHPHVPQGVETYLGKPIFYSLGNFYFDNTDEKRSPYWDKGLVALLTIDVAGLSYEIIPIIKNKSNLGIDKSETAKNYIKYLNNLLSNEGIYLKRVEEEVLRLYDTYKMWMLGGLNAVEINFSNRSIKSLIKGILRPKKNLKITLHQLREESTKWLLARALKIKSNSRL